MSVEIVQPGRIPDKMTHYHGSCGSCGCRFNVTKDSRAIDWGDQRDPGPYMPCPTCQSITGLSPGKHHQTDRGNSGEMK
jgi:hypothetical protein